MAAEIKLVKTDERPWGFRLTGGRDFGTPLTIIKVGAGSLAEQAGMKVGDILIRINEESTSLLSHRDVQEKILSSGNTINLAVLRGSLTLSDQVLDRLTPLPIHDVRPSSSMEEQQPNLQVTEEQQQPQQRVLDSSIEIIPIQDLEPEQLEELGLRPLPNDFLEKAKRDPSPLPQVKPLTCSTPVPEVLQVLEDLGLPEVVQEIEQARPQLEQEQTITPLAEGSALEEQQPTEEPPQPGAPPAAAPLPEKEFTQTEASNEPKKDLTEAEFAELILENAEVIKGTNAIGVNFKKYEPQADFLKKSEVFLTLHEGEIRKEVDCRRWTTFLERPNRPIPKQKNKPKQKPQGIKSALVPQTQETAQEDEPSVQEPELQTHGLYEIPPQEEFEALVKIPTPTPESQEQQIIETEQVDTETQLTEQQPLIEQEQIGEQQEEEEGGKEQIEQEKEQIKQEKEIEEQQQQQLDQNNTVTAEKSDIELQLEEIQRQLEAIQQLPFEIQQHLSMVQDQLTKIVQLKHEQETHQQIPVEQQKPETPAPESETPAPEPETQINEEIIEQEPTEQVEIEQKPEEIPEEQQQHVVEEPVVLPPEKTIKKERKPRPFGGIGPAPRPLILPGGRKWRTPKDAYNDEFIAETLSAQAEIITGSTLGVNFRKYEPKHTNLEFLKDSRVYKLVHDLDESNIGGFPDRPEMLPAIQDYIQATPAAI